MPILIPATLHHQMLSDASASPDQEICGLLLGRYDRVEAFAPAHNVAADPARTFEVDPATLIAAHKAARAGGALIMGCYHSHPNGRAEPSRQDAAEASELGWIWLIIAGGDMTAWRVVEGGALHDRFDPVPILQS